jgi:hypothetical protein
MLGVGVSRAPRRTNPTICSAAFPLRDILGYFRFPAPTIFTDARRKN